MDRRIPRPSESIPGWSIKNGDPWRSSPAVSDARRFFYPNRRRRDEFRACAAARVPRACRPGCLGDGKLERREALGADRNLVGRCKFGDCPNLAGGDGVAGEVPDP